MVSTCRFSPCEHRKLLVGETEQRPEVLFVNGDRLYYVRASSLLYQSYPAICEIHAAFLLFLLTCLGVFLGLGLSGIIPTMHFTIAEGFVKATTVGQMGWFILMGAMYITGAGLYAARIPERFFPGKCDIWVRHYSGDRYLAFVNRCQTVSHSTFIIVPLISHLFL